jgi:hypothetical protein
MTGKYFAKMSTTISNGVGRVGGGGRVAVGSPVLQQMPTAKTRHGQGGSECNVQLTKKLKEMRIQKIVKGRNTEKGREMKQDILVHIPRENREIKSSVVDLVPDPVGSETY